VDIAAIEALASIIHAEGGSLAAGVIYGSVTLPGLAEGRVRGDQG